MDKVGVAAFKIDDNFPLLGIYFELCTSSLKELNLTNLHNLKPKITIGKIYISFPFEVKSQEFYGVSLMNSGFRSLEESIKMFPSLLVTVVENKK